MPTCWQELPWWGKKVDAVLREESVIFIKKKMGKKIGSNVDFASDMVNMKIDSGLQNHPSYSQENPIMQTFRC